MSKHEVNRIFFVWAILIALVALIGRVSIAAPNAGRTAADFLQVGIGARAAGMGGAFTALAEGPDASYWNPAGLGGIDDRQFSASHFSWYQDISLNQGALAIPLSQKVGLAASMTFVNYGKIEGFDALGNSTGDITAGDWAGGLSIGATLTDKIKAGFTGRFISQRLADITASGFAVDFGVSMQVNNFSISAAASNIGPTMKFASVSEKLPAAVRLGVAYVPSKSFVVGALEVEKKVFGDIVTRQGFELRFNDQYFLRSGLSFYPGQGDYRSLKAGYSLGAGLLLKSIQVDYAFTPSANLTSDDLHRFSLGFRF